MMKLLLLTFVTTFVATSSFSQIVNGNFESGRNSGWTEYSQGNYTLIATGGTFASTDIQPAVTPRSGSWMARVGGFSYEINSISQTISLPNSKPLYLAFFAQTRSANTSECGGLFVGAKISIIVNNQAVYSTYLCQYNDLQQWTPLYIDMSAIAGQSATVTFKAEAANSVWSFLYIDDVSITSTTPVADPRSVPSSIELKQNYPNPFNPSTTFEYSIYNRSHVLIEVFNTLGEHVATLVDRTMDGGNYQVTWNGKSSDGAAASSGSYIYRLSTNGEVRTKKMVLIK
jgi:hypothetical protein